ncbi:MULTISPECIES: hypothetical protein [unclassified Leifsonia]|uniref:hypothetical protein n=1 Tax=unclassified Leifsonia TaxID=2663824 RepID=UPI0006F84B34|nr:MULTISPECIES: hypothetical protein [unclassified Leifsonia]KQX08180.1 hypothetical protein ASC59_10980 [Leifsonia sp. Root1293]KRA12462.1 hypothetical protein ASD61_10980 [Leifsonia sp. Root60]
MTVDPSAPDRFRFAHVPDTSDTRLYIELASYARDLADATATLEHAVQLQADGLAELSDRLVDHAVLAYSRAFTHSKARGWLVHHLEVPRAQLDIHDQIRAYRNRTLAHSQSELATTWPTLVFDTQTGTRHVMATTVVQPLPWELVTSFQALVDAVLAELDTLIDDVGTRIAETFGAMPLESIELDNLRVTDAPALAFDPKRERGRYPRSLTMYWSSAPGDRPDSPSEGRRT